MTIDKEGMATKAFTKVANINLPVGKELDCS